MRLYISTGVGENDPMMLIVRAICAGREGLRLDSETFRNLVYFEVRGGNHSGLLLDCSNRDIAMAERAIQGFRKELANGKIMVYMPVGRDVELSPQPDLIISTLPNGAVWPDREAVMAFLHG